MAELAKQAISKLETRKFKGNIAMQRFSSRMSDLYSINSDAETCAICLEEYHDGQVGNTSVHF